MSVSEVGSSLPALSPTPLPPLPLYFLGAGAQRWLAKVFRLGRGVCCCSSPRPHTPLALEPFTGVWPVLEAKVVSRGVRVIPHIKFPFTSSHPRGFIPGRREYLSLGRPWSFQEGRGLECENLLCSPEACPAYILPPNPQTLFPVGCYSVLFCPILLLLCLPGDRWPSLSSSLSTPRGVRVITQSPSLLPRQLS